MTPSTHFTAGNTPDAPRSDLPGLLDALAGDLRGIGYTVDGVAGLLGPAAHSALGRDQLVPALIVTEAARHGEPTTAALAAVVRLWLLAEPQPAADLDAALPGVRTAGPAGTGPRGAVRGRPGPGEGGPAAVRLGRSRRGRRPGGRRQGHRGKTLPAAAARSSGWPATSPPTSAPGVLRHDHVLGIGQASTTLVQVTARRHVARALDLGTGCGIQTFHLLHHAEHVTATDISDRALAFTRFNLLLNAGQLHLDPSDLEARVSLRRGSLLDPVAGEEFELVVSNPPFVITPRSLGEAAADQFTYRDGGLPGDDIVASLVRALPSVLTPGGTAQLLGNWEIPAGAAWARTAAKLGQPGRGRLVHPARAGQPGAVRRDLAAGRLRGPGPAALPGLVRRLPGRLRLPQRRGHRLRNDLAAAPRRGPAGR